MTIPPVTVYFLTALDMALMIWGQQTFAPIIPTFPPPPTMNAVINGPVVVLVGENVTVREDERVIIDCSEVIDRAIMSGIPNPTVNWLKDGVVLNMNGSAPNVVISGDRRRLIIADTLLAVGGQLGNDGDYTCDVCTDFMDPNCNVSSPVCVCGGPNISPPSSPAVVTPGFILLTCGQDVVVPTLQGVATLLFRCSIFNGSCPVPQVFKDGVQIRDSFQLILLSPSDADFGTYTFRLSTKCCGSTMAVSRIIRQVEEDCSVTNITGNLKHNRRRRRTRLQFSSDNPRATYRCKLDDEKFENCNSPVVWRNLKRGRHTVVVSASCIDDEGNASSMRRTFKVRVR